MARTLCSVGRTTAAKSLLANRFGLMLVNWATRFKTSRSDPKVAPGPQSAGLLLAALFVSSCAALGGSRSDWGLIRRPIARPCGRRKRHLTFGVGRRRHHGKDFVRQRGNAGELRQPWPSHRARYWTAIDWMSGENALANGTRKLADPPACRNMYSVGAACAASSLGQSVAPFTDRPNSTPFAGWSPTARARTHQA